MICKEAENVNKNVKLTWQLFKDGYLLYKYYVVQVLHKKKSTGTFSAVPLNHKWREPPRIWKSPRLQSTKWSSQPVLGRKRLAHCGRKGDIKIYSGSMYLQRRYKWQVTSAVYVGSEASDAGFSLLICYYYSSVKITSTCLVQLPGLEGDKAAWPATTVVNTVLLSSTPWTYFRVLQ